MTSNSGLLLEIPPHSRESTSCHWKNTRPEEAAGVCKGRSDIHQENCQARRPRTCPICSFGGSRGDPKSITWLYVGAWDEGRGGGQGGRGDAAQRIWHDRRHVGSLCRGSSCAMCVVCGKRDAARHTGAEMRDAFL
ncbi:hypothetical protein KM043_002532 [Ampulex compressa]|nr:hypothetical protein KM043_002532 [Ampulex compressa]